MATAATPTKGTIQNWVKGALALYFAKESLEEFVLSEVTDFQNDLLKSISKQIGNPLPVTCSSCTTANILPCPTTGFCTKGGGKCKVHDPKDPKLMPNVTCPRNICQAIRGGIRREHRYYVAGKSEPSWKNADATQFCSNPFSLAKCYMSLDGYSEVQCLTDTDFNGIINILLNNKRFQNKMAAKLHQRVNICTEARDIGRLIRHSPNLSISDAEVIKYIDTLIALLSDPKYLAVDKKAQAGVAKLQALKVNSVSLDDEKIKQIIKDAIEDTFHKKQKLAKDDIAEHALQEKAEMLNTFHEAVKDHVKVETKASLNQISSTTKDVLKEILNARSLAVQEIDETKKHLIKPKNVPTKTTQIKFGNELIMKDRQSITIHLSEQVEAEICISPKSGSETDFDKLRLAEGLREDLVHYYRENCSTIPVSPLVEEHDAPLLSLYVSQNIVSVDVMKVFNRFQEPPDETPVNSCYDMFFCESNPYKNIYVSARAGLGKTSFVKNLCMIWCHAKDTDTTVTRFKKQDIEAVNKFDFLFLIFLRDANTSYSDVEDMIESQLLRRLPRNLNYSKQFLANILHDKMCLIILDGLDEWIHPCGPECKMIPIPHRISHQKCTIITTTRPWKLYDLPLGINDIDKHLKICELDTRTASLLTENAVSLLNEKSKHPKSAKDIKTLVAQTKPDQLLFTPYILLQFICLWFDGKLIAHSKCELYTNVLNLTLSRGIRQKGFFHSDIQNLNQIKTFPACFSDTEECKRKYGLLLRIGRLAFETLFGEDRQSRLVFEESTDTKYITKKDIETCVILGILTKNKIFGNVSSRRSNYSFQHKSMQEYFAALYIQSKPDNVEVKRKIERKCYTLPAVLEMSPIFVFVSGFNQYVANDILCKTLGLASKDDVAQSYRSGSSLLRSLFINGMAIQHIQNMIVNCAQESINNGHKDIEFRIENIVVDVKSKQNDNLGVLQALLEIESSNVISFTLKECKSANEANSILQKLNTKKMCHLRKLDLRTIPLTQVLQPLLNGNTWSLQCLELCSLEFDTYTHRYYPKSVNLPSEHIHSILNMFNLQVLTLGSLRIGHSDMSHLSTFLTGKTAMRQIILYHIECSAHHNICDGFSLDLSGHKCLQAIWLVSIPLSNLSLNPISIEECWVGKLAPKHLTYVFECLQKSEMLHTLYCLRLDNLEAMMTSIPKLGQLKYISFQEIDFGNRVISISSITKTIEIISCNGIKMSSTALRLLVNSIEHFPHEVDICLENCKVSPVEDYEEIKGLIRSSPNFTVTLDALNKCKKRVFNFGTIKTHLRRIDSFSDKTLVLQSTRF